jgi:AraC-like DNA-binding protein
MERGVATKVGLSSRTHFSQAFMSFHGVSPTEFRSVSRARTLRSPGAG